MHFFIFYFCNKVFKYKSDTYLPRHQLKVSSLKARGLHLVQQYRWSKHQEKYGYQSSTWNKFLPSKWTRRLQQSTLSSRFNCIDILYISQRTSIAMGIIILESCEAFTRFIKNSPQFFLRPSPPFQTLNTRVSSSRKIRSTCLPKCKCCRWES